MSIKRQKLIGPLKNRLKNEGSEVVTNCDQVKLLAEDGKMRETDVANVETVLRLVQSVPSKKAEPIKLWLARVGYERMQENIWRNKFKVIEKIFFYDKLKKLSVNC